MLRTFSLWLLLIVSAAIFTTACTKDDMSFGHDYLNKSDFVQAFIDSSTVIGTTTVLDDSLRSSYIMYMVGQTAVPGFSTQSKAEFMNRFYFENLSIDLSAKNTKLQLKSITLELAPKPQFLGDSVFGQKIEIRELTQDITREKVKEYYNTGARPDIASDILGTTEFQARPSDTTAIKFTFPAARAETLFGDIRQFYEQDTSAFYNDSVLNRVFKGLHIKSLEGNAIMNYGVRIVIETNQGTVNLLPTLYAYNQTAAQDGTPFSQQELDLYVQVLTMFEHTYIEEIQSQLNKPSDISYVSGLMGLKTQLKFEDFNRWKDSLVVFNFASLQVPVIKQINRPNEVEMQNKTLRLNIYNAEHKLVAASPVTPETADSVMYNFDITQFMTVLRRNAQQASDYTFEIVMPDNNRYGNAFKIDATDNRIKLILRYSR